MTDETRIEVILYRIEAARACASELCVSERAGHLASAIEDAHWSAEQCKEAMEQEA